MSSRLAWFTWLVPGQPGLPTEKCMEVANNRRRAVVWEKEGTGRARGGSVSVFYFK